MATDEHERFCIYESRTENMVDGEIKLRIGRFLKPSSSNIVQSSSGISKSSILAENFSEKTQKFQFRCSKTLQKKWGEWVDYLAGKYAYFWNQTRICDAILNSLHETRCNPSLILGLVQYWCPETNTFVFPFGEATITLEDVMILGGFSVLGEPVNTPLTEDLMIMEEKMNQLLKQIVKKSKSKKGGYGGLIRFFMELEGKDHHHELDEHVGFLSLWLSRYVFPSVTEPTMISHVFRVAIHLSRGTRMALAPAVLSSLYKNLRLLKEQAFSSMEEESVLLFGPFQLLQLWAFERFPILGPKCPIELKPGEPRTARWHKLTSNASVSLIRSVLKSGENFQWRPFASDLKNWCFVSHYKDNEQLVIDGLNSEEGLRSFGICMCANELVGLDCSEKYMPYRVGMQFGMDQDIPGDFTLILPNCRKNFSFYVPARGYKPFVSLKYLKWWKGAQEQENMTQMEGPKKDEEILKQISEQEMDCVSTASRNGQKRKISTQEQEIMTQMEGTKLESQTKDEEILKQVSETELELPCYEFMVDCVSTALGNGQKRKISTQEVDCVSTAKGNDNTGLFGDNIVVITDEAKDSVLKNDPSNFCEHKKKIEENDAIGSFDNPVDVDDYACVVSVGTCSNPIDIDKYI